MKAKQPFRGPRYKRILSIDMDDTHFVLSPAEAREKLKVKSKVIDNEVNHGGFVFHNEGEINHSVCHLTFPPRVAKCSNSYA